MRIDTTRRCEDCGTVLLRTESGICEDCEKGWEPLIFEKEKMDRMEEDMAFRANAWDGEPL